MIKNNFKVLLFFILLIIILFLLFNCQQPSNSIGGGKNGKGSDDNTPSLIWSSQVKKTASDTENNDWFGTSVSISGDYVIVGAPNEDGEGTDRGAAYIFHRTGTNTWDSGTKITAPFPENNDWFGSSVSISGDYVIVGAPGVNGIGSNRGAAYMFGRTGLNTWSTGNKITASDDEDGDEFGFSVSISGDYVIVGAPFEDGEGTDRGAIYTFHRFGLNNWGTGRKLTPSYAGDNDWYGISVAISGDYIIVGASHEDDGVGTNRGAVYISHRLGENFFWNGNKRIATDDADNDKFGTAVSISGDYAIAGASFEDGDGTDRGAVYIFHRIGPDSWDNGIKLTAPDPEDEDYFGNSVSISGDYVIIGAPCKNTGGANRGAAYIFHRTGIKSWAYETKLKALDREDNDELGFSVTISDNYAIVGAPYEDGDGNGRGAAYIYFR